ncbi:MAG: bacillithiol biosynthesis deacetylase BshB1 [FCB group bacterium]|nr:bacillithiol biosynthesis deacetylase BshB1 [FCB group bacterium]
MTVDVLAVGAHPDDVELGVGGTVNLLVRDGYSVAILDLTRGEMGSRGTPEERAQEAADAAHVLGVESRLNAGLPDGQLMSTPDMRLRVIPFIRQLRPRLLLLPMGNDKHPDHGAAHQLLVDANYLSGLAKIESGEEPYRAPRAYFYPAYAGAGVPAMVVDISDTFETKMQAIGAYRSQFHNPDYEGRDTYISRPEFWDAIQSKAAYWGARIDARYGEPLFTDGPVGVSALPGLEMRL